MIYSVHQPHYLPYPGYLAKVALSDVFVFLEEVQYVKREWQNRNKVKSPQGTAWLTVPVKGEYKSRICDMTIDQETNWLGKHEATLNNFYSKAEYASEIKGFLEIINRPHKWLSELTIATTSYLLDAFGINTRRYIQSEFNPLSPNPNQRIVEIGNKLGADTYLAGIGGKNYMDVALFNEAGIEVKFLEMPIIEYPQLNGEFIPHLGSIDLLLNTGTEGYFQHIHDNLKEIF